MASTTSDNDIPQWKKDLIARLRTQNKLTSLPTVAVVGRHQQQLCTDPPQNTSGAVGCGTVQQPNITFSSNNSVASVNLCSSVQKKCNLLRPTCSTTNPSKMVQERVWVDNKHDDYDLVSSTYENGEYNKNSDSDSSEDLHYGPGIVNKLKNKYLSLALRETNIRPTILPIRKAASLENILDDDIPNGPIGNRLFQPRLNGSNDTGKNVPNRYRNATRGSCMKRARSVETISSTDNHINLITTEEVRPKRESLHEEMLINDKEGNDKLNNRKMFDNKLVETTNETKIYNHRINRPKKITPIMNEKEKPPVDVVKHAKLIFERPEQRTRSKQATGEVAAKVATYKNIIVQAKNVKKPPIKHKPIGLTSNGNVRLIKPNSNNMEKEEQKNEVNKIIKLNNGNVNVPNAILTSPIPDVSRIDFPHVDNEHGSRNSSLSETPDLILTSSPLSAVSSPTLKISVTEKFIKEEIRHSFNNKKDMKFVSPQLSPSIIEKIQDEQDIKLITPQTINNNASNSVTFNFSAKTNHLQDHLPVNKNISNIKTPPSQPLKLDINCVNNLEFNKKLPSPKILQQAQNENNDISSSSTSITTNKPILNNDNRNQLNKTNLTTVEMEKNLINTAKSMEQQPKLNNSVNKNVDETIKIQVPKVKRLAREPESNSIVFKFTDRKDVPDYVHNDKSRAVTKIERPKVGEGGIILLPGASIEESFTDEDEEILRSLEAPPSPCDVMFLNDNILIDGKSSLSQKTKKSKMKISFVDAGPEIFEYPSESSLLLEDIETTSTNPQMGHTVPSLTGSSSLANYTPKSTEDFQPGVTRTNNHNIPVKNDDVEHEHSDLLLQEVDKPILFSAGTNSDMLF